MWFLAAPARRFAAQMPLNNNNSGHGPETGHHKAKWLDLKAEPPKHEEVAERHGDRGDKNDEERAVHYYCGLQVEPAPVRLGPVRRRSRVSLPDRDAGDSRAIGHRVHLAS